MKRLILSVFTMGLFAATPGAAQDRPVVVELFTSQGCSSCPPADKILSELTKREDVIALALHVDYWDYIGWKDPFGDPLHAARQRAYAKAGDRRSIYTPEIIINGHIDIVGAKPMVLARAIDAQKKAPELVALTVTRDGDQVQIDAEARIGAIGPLTVHMLRYEPSASTEIKRGENAGHTFENHNIVNSWTVLTQWDARAPLTLAAPAPGTQPVVVLIQKSGAGPIMAAARVK